MEILIGQKYGMLKVIEYVGRTNYRQNKWKCICECGKVIIRTQRALEDNNRIHSCGCFTEKNLLPATKEICSKAGKKRAEIMIKDEICLNTIDNQKNFITNTSGHKGISWSKTAHKWHVFIGYKNYRCNLAFIENFDEAVRIRESAVEAIKNGTFEDFFYQLRGFRIEDRIKKQKKSKQ